MHRMPLAAAALLALPIAAQESRAQESRAVAVELPALAQSRYFRIDPQPGTKTPKDGFGLLVVLPGGPGTADFLPWVERSVVPQLPAGFVAAMLTAPQWRADQGIVWPTVQNPVDGMQYGTEAYVRAVVADVQKAHAIDRQRLLLLAWSSSGPAAYELLLSGEPAFRGAYVAMSVFRDPGQKRLQKAKGLRFVLDQSPDDTTTRFVFAERAQRALCDAGATVWLQTYRGGHGWHGDAKARLQQGLRWLCSDEPPPPSADDLQAASDNLLRNGGFEDQLAGWQVFGNSGRMQAEAAAVPGCTGKAALHLRKKGGVPLDLVRQEVRKLAKAEQLLVSCRVRSSGCGNALVKFFLYDDADRVVAEQVDLVQLRGDQDWQPVQKAFDARRASYGVLQVVMVLDGEVWVDDVRVVAAEPAKGN